MGQKTNATIFRLNNWKLQCVEKNKEEHNLFNYQNIEIQEYLNQFFFVNGLNIHNLKIKYSQKKLYIFICYLPIKEYSPKTGFQFKHKTKTQKKENKIPKFTKISSFISSNSEIKNSTKFKRLKILSQYNKSFINDLTFMKRNDFLQQIFETLNRFTGNLYDVNIVMENLNQGLILNLNNQQKNEIRRKLILLKQYSKTSFFDEGISVLIIVIKFKNSSFLLNNYINKHFKELKKQSVFLIFLKRALDFFIFFNFSKVLGIKIVIKGRFNSAPRAKKKIISVGNVPTQSISKTIDFSETTVFTKNGTFGLKIWIHYKD